MIRSFLACSALAASLAVAAPAGAETSLHIDLTGKAPAVAYAAIVSAARSVCRPETGNEIYAPYLTSTCVKDTIAATIEKIGDPALSQYARNRDAFLLASN